MSRANSSQTNGVREPQRGPAQGTEADRSVRSHMTDSKITHERSEISHNLRNALRASEAGSRPLDQSLDLEQQLETDVAICCSHSSLYGLKYLSRIGISSSILLFSFYSIAKNPQDDNSIYFSLISSILGYYISLKDKSE